MSEEKILEPNPKDVLGGRGAAARKHQGNIDYSRLLHENRDDYVNAKKGYKKDVLNKIIASIEDGGGRFLDKHNEHDPYWIVMNKEKVHAKVSQGLRDLRPSGGSVAVKKRSGPKPGVAKPTARSASNAVGGRGSFPNNGTLPGQPRRLSFAERVKLLQQEELRAANGGKDDDGSSDEQ